ncbi:unnamed protein product [Colias eurytheme]|nr:unnamed protein product [Colias eurytheme]
MYTELVSDSDSVQRRPSEHLIATQDVLSSGPGCVWLLNQRTMKGWIVCVLRATFDPLWGCTLDLYPINVYRPDLANFSDNHKKQKQLKLGYGIAEYSISVAKGNFGSPK